MISFYAVTIDRPCAVIYECGTVIKVIIIRTQNAFLHANVGVEQICQLRGCSCNLVGNWCKANWCKPQNQSLDRKRPQTPPPPPRAAPRRPAPRRHLRRRCCPDQTKRILKHLASALKSNVCLSSLNNC